jgi:hypothetical protein
MAPLVKGVLLGMVGAVVLAPIVFLLALVGIPLFVAGAVVIGVLLAIPLLVLAAISLPFLVLAGVLGAALVVALVAAAKIALWVVLPIALITLAVTWLVRTSESRRAASG